MRCTEVERELCDCDKLGCKGCFYNKEVSDEKKEGNNNKEDTTND